MEAPQRPTELYRTSSPVMVRKKGKRRTSKKEIETPVNVKSQTQELGLSFLPIKPKVEETSDAKDTKRRNSRHRKKSENKDTDPNTERTEGDKAN